MAPPKLSLADMAANLNDRNGKNWPKILTALEHQITDLKRALEAKEVELAVRMKAISLN